MTRTCSIEGCERSHYGRGFCRSHWDRWKRHGDPCGGRIPPGAALAFIAQAAAHQSDECLEWPYRRWKGHGRVWADGAMRTQGPPSDPSMQAAHAPVVCHNRACVNPRHLRWATVAENHADKVPDGTHRRGERTPGSKLTDAQVLEIRADRRLLREIAADYGVAESTVSLIRNRKNWAWLAGPPDHDELRKS